MALMIPTVHLNGTGRAELLQQQLDAMEALRALREALGQAAPNGRDYYPQGDGATNAAIAQHRARLTKLDEIEAELQAIAEGIDQQGKR